MREWGGIAANWRGNGWLGACTRRCESREAFADRLC